MSDNQKQKAKAVRKQGACLRCKVLRIECSLESPCKPCLSSALKGFERRVLSFTYCIHTRYAEVNIFEGSLEDPHIAPKAALLLARHTPPPGSFLSNEDFDLLSTTWLTEPNTNIGLGSVVGFLSSPGQLAPLDEAVDDSISSDFRVFLLSTSLSQCGWQDHDISLQELDALSYTFGSRLINRLDRILTPQFLAKLDTDAVKAVFLLILGTNLAVTYAAHVTSTSTSFPHHALAPNYQSNPSLWVSMKEHLCHMLGHHLIFVGSRLGVKFVTGDERDIIEKATRRWNKPDTFVWANALLDTAVSSLEEPPPQYSPGPIVPVSCPELRLLGHAPGLLKQETFQAQQEKKDGEEASQQYQDENPPGWWLTDDDTPEMTPPPYCESAFPQHGVLDDDDGIRRQPRRRSMWIVRPYDTQTEAGMVNVHARLRVEPGQDIGLFL